MEGQTNRRPLKSRSTAWAQYATALLLKTPITPNAVSVIGIGFAAVGAGAFLLTPHSQWWWLLGAVCVQLRLVANLLDGLVAVEGGRKSSSGVLFNEFPDRIEDSLLLIAAGYAAGWPTLGWAAALLAVGTAYVRALGGSIGLEQDFCGPMAKPQRMALLTGGAVLCAFLPTHPIMAVALGIIILGAAVTFIRRLVRQARALKEASQ